MLCLIFQQPGTKKTYHAEVFDTIEQFEARRDELKRLGAEIVSYNPAMHYVGGEASQPCQTTRFQPVRVGG